MTYHYRDSDGHDIEATPETGWHDEPVVTIWARRGSTRIPVRIPVDRLEELIAGLRDTARQATGATPDHRHAAALHYLAATNIPEQPDA